MTFRFFHFLQLPLTVISTHLVTLQYSTQLYCIINLPLLALVSTLLTMLLLKYCWLAEKVILEALKNASVLMGNVEDMMTQRLGAVFMPHGLGHLLGIDTHDPGGYLKGLERPKEPGLKSLRTVRQLEQDMVITVEPGCYFINALLNPAMQSSLTAKFFNRDAIRRFEGFGGVRIESDVYVTTNGCKNMTNVPRKIWEIEAVMAGGKWPLH